jgi:hypothetical protein
MYLEEKMPNENIMYLRAQTRISFYLKKKKKERKKKVQPQKGQKKSAKEIL